jgi:hypothetical protein
MLRTLRANAPTPATVELLLQQAAAARWRHRKSHELVALDREEMHLQERPPNPHRPSPPAMPRMVAGLYRE